MAFNVAFKPQTLMFEPALAKQALHGEGAV
jgi:hypothetical protein